jgi:hypothetical protein
MDEARIMLPMSEKEVLAIEPNTRFTLWDGNKPVGEYLVHIFEMIDEIYYSIEEIIPHSEDGINLDWEERKSIFDGFCKENTEEIIRLISTGEDGTVKGKYIKILSPRFPSLKEWNHKYRECHEKWVTEDEFEEKILNPIGEATYEKVWDAINDGKTIEWRYINCNYYKDSISNSGSRIDYIQMFADGKNIGWCEDHPHREYKKLEDGRTIAIGEPTVYYNILLSHKSTDGYEVKTHRIGSLFCWVKREN